MARIAIIDRADMNAEQARVYDAAKATGGPVGGPYYAYIRLPKFFDASPEPEGLPVVGTAVRAASSRSPTSSSPGTGAPVIRGSRRRGLRSPSASTRRSSTRSTRARRRSWPTPGSGPAMRLRLSPGSTLGPYTLAQALGRGSTATVFLARRAEHEVALKVRGAAIRSSNRLSCEFEALAGSRSRGGAGPRRRLDRFPLALSVDNLSAAPQIRRDRGGGRHRGARGRLLHVAPPLCDALAGYAARGYASAP